MMKALTLTRQDLAQKVLIRLAPIFETTHCEQIVDHLFAIFSDTLLNRKIICIKNIGFICPVYKSARNGVRNPQTGEDAIMEAHWTAKLRSSKNEHPSLSIAALRDKLRLTLLSNNLLISFSKQKQKSIVLSVIDVIFDAIHSVETGKFRIETRGFGVILPVLQKARTARNPKTGESVQVGEYYKISYRISTVLHKQMNHSYCP
jgi:integration host factor subunit beta